MCGFSSYIYGVSFFGRGVLAFTALVTGRALLLNESADDCLGVLSGRLEGIFSSVCQLMRLDALFCIINKLTILL